MKPGVKAFGLSLMVHAAIAGVAIMTAASNVSPPRIVYIDFFVENSLSGDSVEADSGNGDSGRLQGSPDNVAVTHDVFHEKKGHNTVPVHPAVRKKSFRKADSTAVRKREKSPAESGRKCRMASDKADKTGAAKADAGGTGSHVSAFSASISKGSEGEGNGTAADRYMLEHFLYIRDLVRKNLRYPRAAITLGLSGKVGVSFTVLENGEVGGLEVVASSGARILDIDAVETIQRSAPFPAPPALARIVIPVEYILE